MSGFRLNAGKKLEQGLSVDAQYRVVNRAREKRKARRHRNLKAAISGSFAQIPIIKCQ